MSRWHKGTILLNHKVESEPVPIIADGAIAAVGVADGRLIPVLIVDASSRPDVEDMIRAHKGMDPGDVESIWAMVSQRKPDHVRLVLSFARPVRCIVLLEFDIVHQGGLVDQIVQSECLFLQSGQEGSRLSSTLPEHRILVEVPSKVFRPEWDRILHEALVKDLRKRGFGKQEAARKAGEAVQVWRQLGRSRAQQH